MFICGFFDQKACSSSLRMLVSLTYSFFKDWYPAIFWMQCRASSSSLLQCESLKVSTFQTAIETANVLSPFGVISVFLSYSVVRLMRYLEKAMLERDLSVIWLFFCFMLLFKTSVLRERLFSLSLSSSTPMSPIWQSSRKSSFNFMQCFDRPREQRVLFVILCQLMLRFRDQSSPQDSVLRKQPMPSSSTDVACRSKTFRCLTKVDSAKMTRPSLEISEFPQRINCYSFAIHGQRAMRTSESSVIWLSARLRTRNCGKMVNQHSVSTVASVIKLKFCDRSKVSTISGVLIPFSNFRESSLMLEFLKERAFAFSMLLLYMLSLSSASSISFRTSPEDIFPFGAGRRQQSIIIMHDV